MSSSGRPTAPLQSYHSPKQHFSTTDLDRDYCPSNPDHYPDHHSFTQSPYTSWGEHSPSHPSNAPPSQFGWEPSSPRSGQAAEGIDPFDRFNFDSVLHALDDPQAPTGTMHPSTSMAPGGSQSRDQVMTNVWDDSGLDCGPEEVRARRRIPRSLPRTGATQMSERSPFTQNPIKERKQHIPRSQRRSVLLGGSTRESIRGPSSVLRAMSDTRCSERTAKNKKAMEDLVTALQRM